MEHTENSEESEEINILEDESETLEDSRENNETETIPVEKDPNKETKKERQSKQNLLHSKFTFARVKKLMKMDPEVNLVEKEAVHLVGKATELFIDYISREAGKHINKRKTLMIRDVDIAIESVPHLCFLDGALE